VNHITKNLQYRHVFPVPLYSCHWTNLERSMADICNGHMTFAVSARSFFLSETDRPYLTTTLMFPPPAVSTESLCPFILSNISHLIQIDQIPVRDPLIDQKKMMLVRCGMPPAMLIPYLLASQSLSSESILELQLDVSITKTCHAGGSNDRTPGHTCSPCSSLPTDYAQHPPIVYFVTFRFTALFVIIR
jgi:hypothetical protein